MSLNLSYSFGYKTLVTVPTLASNQSNKNIVVTVYPDWYKQIVVEWSVPPSFGSCLFDVFFSPTLEGPYTKINLTPLTGTYLQDTQTQEYSKNNRGYYIVQVTLTSQGNAILRSLPTSWTTYQRKWVELRSIEVQRREYWLLTQFAGIKSYLFRRKSYGERCKTCWNPVLEVVTNDHCPDCLGTSFEGGYFDPAMFYVQYDATPNVLLKTYFGNYEPNQIGAWTISIPDVRPQDVIVRIGDWNVYRVERLTPTELQGNTVRQIMVLTELSRQDVEFQLVKRSLPDFPANLLT